jgi:ABC-2 type transport system ATP-binding protein
METTPIIIKNIHKSFSDKTVLDDINFEVLNNEIFGFVGLNGIGKTTLIKIMIDLLDQDHGEVKIFGKEKFLPSSRENVAYLPEKFMPSMNLKGVEFLEFVSGFHKKKLDINKAKELARNLDLDEAALYLKVSKYSKGMTQKLGLLGTFLSEAKLIILDEPMSGLDPTARIALKKQLIDYHKAGNTIFFSSHILSDIDEICDRIAVLHDKKIVFLGKPGDFKRKHQEDDLEKAFLKEIS